MDDTMIWQKFKSGDRQAFQYMYEEHIDRLIYYASRFTQQQALIEDVIQDLFVQLWLKRDDLGNTDSIIKYLCTSVRRELIRRLSNNLHIVSADETMHRDQPIDFTIEEEIIFAEDNKAMEWKLQKAIHTLSNREREAVYLKFYQELDYDQICEIMGVNYQSARNLVSKAIKQLKQKLVILWIVMIYLS
jgi:RNA polymerase sigma factor (sigma-70 family)